MSEFETWCRFCPVATVSTGLMLVVCVVALVHGRSRRWLVSKFAPTPPATQTYHAALDSYRGLAAAMVAFAHSVFFCYPVFWAVMAHFPYLYSHGGNKAVPVFVMLSGFLVYRSVKKMDGTAGIREYALRRFFRIYPLYFATTVAVFATGQTPFQLDSLVAEFGMFRPLQYLKIGNPVTWSLYVEISFYVFLPVFTLVTGRWSGRASAVAVVALAVADSAGPREFWVWKFFFLGIVVSHVSDWFANKARPAVRDAIGMVLFAGGVWVLYYDLGGTDADWMSRLFHIPANPAGYSLGLGLGFAMVMVGTLGSRLISALVSAWPLRTLGTISYSIFMIHPFYLLACFPNLRFEAVGTQQPSFAPMGTAPWWYLYFLVFPGLFLWAGVTYLLIERPFMALRPGRTRNPAPTAATAAPEVTPLIASAS